MTGTECPGGNSGGRGVWVYIKGSLLTPVVHDQQVLLYSLQKVEIMPSGWGNVVQNAERHHRPGGHIHFGR